MYDEFDVTPQGSYSHEILLSNGWQMSIQFRDLRLVVAQDLLPASRPSVARTA